MCARRAAGIAVRFWLQQHPRPGWGADVMARLNAVAQDETLPETVRAAAGRLTTRVTEKFALPFQEDPLVDGRAIVGYFLREDTAPDGRTLPRT